jgi:hypothetical protein
MRRQALDLQSGTGFLRRRICKVEGVSGRWVEPRTGAWLRHVRRWIRDRDDGSVTNGCVFCGRRGHASHAISGRGRACSVAQAGRGQARMPSISATVALSRPPGAKANVWQAAHRRHKNPTQHACRPPSSLQVIKGTDRTPVRPRAHNTRIIGRIGCRTATHSQQISAFPTPQSGGAALGRTWQEVADIQVRPRARSRGQLGIQQKNRSLSEGDKVEVNMPRLR